MPRTLTENSPPITPGKFLPAGPADIPHPSARPTLTHGNTASVLSRVPLAGRTGNPRSLHNRSSPSITTSEPDAESLGAYADQGIRPPAQAGLLPGGKRDRAQIMIERGFAAGFAGCCETVRANHVRRGGLPGHAGRANRYRRHLGRRG